MDKYFREGIGGATALGNRGPLTDEADELMLTTMSRAPVLHDCNLLDIGI